MESDMLLLLFLKGLYGGTNCKLFTDCELFFIAILRMGLDTMLSYSGVMDYFWGARNFDREVPLILFMGLF